MRRDFAAVYQSRVALAEALDRRNRTHAASSLDDIRLQIPFAPREVIDMDDVRKLPRMGELAETQNLRPTLRWLETSS